MKNARRIYEEDSYKARKTHKLEVELNRKQARADKKNGRNAFAATWMEV